jgi:hypothetical protein
MMLAVVSSIVITIHGLMGNEQSDNPIKSSIKKQGHQV